MKLIQVILLISMMFFISACVAKKTPANRQSTYPALAEGPKLDNYCANNVQQQFQKAKTNGLTWTRYPWSFNWNKSYEPDSTKPSQFMDNYLVKHVQGFAKTNSSRFPFVGTHSDYNDGGLFVLQRNSEGMLVLSSLHLAGTAHPSGIQVIGKYVVYGANGDLVFKDMASVNQSTDIRLSVESAVYGGGLGLIKQENGMYLAITAGPGGHKGLTRTNYFFEFSMNDSGPDGLKSINSSVVTIPATWSSNYKLSENLSVIRECGTGDIYTVHTTGEVKNILGKLAPFGNDSYWRLSKLQKSNDEYSLTAVNFLGSKQNLGSCNPIATGTVSVSPNNRLEFFCHQHSQNKGSSGEGKYYFEKGDIK